MRRYLTALALVALVVSGAVAATGHAAGGRTFKVLAGEQTRLTSAPKMTTLNAFFPSRLAIHAGDSVTFQSASFHTVAYFPGKLPSAFVPGAGTFEGVVGADGQPFWFNGQRKLAYNPAAFGPIVAKEVVPGTAISSGILSPPGPKSPPATVTWTFPRAGTFKLICTLHAPSMAVTVSVKPASASVPSPAQVASTALADVAKQTAEATKLATVSAPKNTVVMGPGLTSPTRLSFEPAKLTVKAGTTVAFVEQSKSEVHNVAFGPRGWLQAFQKKNDLLPQGPNSPNQLSPLLVYGSEPPGKAFVFDGANHGNGVLVTPLNDNLPGNPPQGLARSSRVTFTKAGTYKYICLLHGPDMSGTIVVTS